MENIVSFPVSDCLVNEVSLEISGNSKFLEKASLTSFEKNLGKYFIVNLIGKHSWTKEFVHVLSKYVSLESINLELIKLFNANQINSSSNHCNASSSENLNIEELFIQNIQYAVRHDLINAVNNSIKENLMAPCDIANLIKKEELYKIIFELYKLNEKEITVLVFLDLAEKLLGDVFLLWTNEDFLKGIGYSLDIPLEEIKIILDISSNLVSSGLVKFIDSYELSYFVNKELIDFFRKGKSIRDIFKIKNIKISLPIEASLIESKHKELARFLIEYSQTCQIVLYGTTRKQLLNFAFSLSSLKKKNPFILNLKDQLLSKLENKVIFRLLSLAVEQFDEDSIFIISNICLLNSINKKTFNSFINLCYKRNAKIIWLTVKPLFLKRYASQFNAAIDVGKIDPKNALIFYNLNLSHLDLCEKIKERVIKYLFKTNFPVYNFHNIFQFLSQISQQHMPDEIVETIVNAYFKEMMDVDALSSNKKEKIERLPSNFRNKKPKGESNHGTEHYSIEVLRTSIDASKIIKSVQNVIAQSSKNHKPIDFKILFYGPPGSGKTALAYHIAQTVGKKIVSYHYSDIADAYIGQTESNIAKMFRNQKARENILLIDEIDSFLFKRKNALRMWEVSQVNEFLTQMEQYQGIFIATTNNLSLLDEAVIRRFQQKVEFFELSNEGVITLLHTYFPNMVFSDEAVERLLKSGSYYPSDFQVVERNMLVLDPEEATAENVINMLINEGRSHNNAKQRPIGFSA